MLPLFAQVLSFLLVLAGVTGHVDMRTAYVCLCTCWDYMLSLVTGWSKELSGAAAAAPLSGCWIGQLLTESGSFPATFLLCSSWQRCQ